MNCGLIGETLGHSFSPAIHRMLGNYSYRLFELSPEELGPFLRNSAFDGLNVTIPYKKAVIPYCAELSSAAQRIGSVNTLLRRPDGTLWGDNTDYDGFRALVLSLGVSPSGKKVLIFGSGGTSLTAQTVLADLGASEIVVVSRSGPVRYEDLPAHRDAAFLVNTTPVGMYPHNGACPADPDLFPQLEGVLDAVYNPLSTELCLRAREHGVPAAGGLLMLVAQAKRAAELFTGQTIPDEKTAEIHARLLGGRKNLVLIGMPGCGKTAVGRALAGLLGRPFVDTDLEVEKRAGAAIPAIFAEQGEGAFRALESEAIRAASARTGQVISTGGGAVLRAENRRALRQNGTVVFLRRPLDRLSSEGRPLSKGGAALETLWREREPVYRAASDFEIENDGRTAKETAAAIAKELKLV